MNSFKEVIDSDFLTWLKNYSFNYKQEPLNSDKGALNLIYSDKFCLKIYDRTGHGFSLSVSVLKQCDETIHNNVKFNLFYAFEYFKIEQTASFIGRSEIAYQQNLPKLKSDIKLILPLLYNLTSSECNEMIEWIHNEAKKKFG